MRRRRVLLYADGAQGIGAGHQVRCAAIAHALAAAGHEAVLGCRDLAGSTHGWAWLGLTVQMVGAESLPGAALHALIGRTAPDVVLVDHYGMSGRDARGVAVPVAMLDDAPERDLTGARLVVNPSPVAAPSWYPDQPVLLGPRSLPLRAEFLAPKPASRGDGILLALGGTDAGGLAARLAPLLAAHGPVRTVAGLPAAEVAAVMDGCRVAVVTASGIAWECLARGLPLVAVQVAGNQAQVAASLAAAGVPVVTAAEIERIPALLSSACAPASLTPAGDGAACIAEVLACLASAPAPLVAGCWNDADRLLAIANQPSVRAVSFRADPIPRSEHLAWLARILGDPDHRLWLSDDGLGTIRLRRDGRSATVSIAIDEAARGQGLGRRLLEGVVGWAGDAGWIDGIDAWVVDGNAASERLFTGRGFIAAEHRAVDGRPSTRYRLGIP